MPPRARSRRCPSDILIMSDNQNHQNGELPGDIETPLLDRHHNDTDIDCSCSPQNGNCSFSGAVSNLAVTAIGAGMLALAKAFSTVGLAVGLLLLFAVCFLTYFSSSVIIRFCATEKRDSYGNLIQAEFGRGGSIVLQSAIVVHVLGVMIVYLIIIDDMLVGSPPTYNGLIPYFLGSGGAAAAAAVDLPFWVSRWCISLLLLVGVVTPMLISRDLSIVSKFSKFSVGMLLLLSATLLGLAGVAALQGKAASIRILPDMATVGGGEGGPEGLMSAVFTFLAVAALAFTCQFNLVPVHNSLRDNKTSTMLRATQASIALCALLYGSIALAGYTLFGDATDGDVLKNLTVNFVTEILGQRPAEALIAFVFAANTLNLLINFVLKVWAVREAGCEMVLGVQARQLRPVLYYVVTGALVCFAYGISVSFGNNYYVYVFLLGPSSSSL